MTLRVGVFFIFFGGVGMWIYFATDLSGSPRFAVFFLSLFSILVGIYLFRKGYTAPPPSSRFSALNKLRKKDENKE